MFQRSHFRSASTTNVNLANTEENLLNLPSSSSTRDNLNKTKSQIILQSSFRRIVIAVATLRVTSTSTTATVTTTSAGSLSALLKSLLVGCYYIIAFTSLLMLILYINQHVTQNDNNNNIYNQEKFILKPAAISLKKMVMIDKSNLNYHQNSNMIMRSKRSAFMIVNARNITASPPATNHEITKSLYNRQGNKDKTTTSRFEQIFHISNNSFGSMSRRSDTNPDLKPDPDPIIHAVPTKRPPPKQQITKQPATKWNSLVTRLPELTERQASYYSVNNRGSMNSSITKQPTESQWIPILNPQKISRIYPYDKSRQGKPPIQSSQPAMAPSTNTADVIKATYHRESNQHRHRYNSHSHRHQFHHHPTNQQHGSLNYPGIGYHNHHQWRQPRYNVGYENPGIRPSKVYKRVLLCDKTLVSLDYVKNLDLKPSPFGVIVEHDFDDNVIDLDSNMNQIFVDRRQANTTLSPASGSGNIAFAETRDDNYSDVITDRRSYLTDENPLVKCDMWDLEKGLKNRKPPRQILQMAIKADFDTVRDAINRCRQLSEKTLPPDDEYRDGIEIMSTEDLVSLFSVKRGLIPGTKWCGLGDQASNYNDLGPKHRIDICCRAHDHCPIRLKPFRNDYGVLNIALYTKSHCDCDADFYRCLREVQSRTADMLGNLYFNVMKLQCMREERMKICREMKHIALGFERCIRYEDSPIKTVFKFTTPPVAY